MKKLDTKKKRIILLCGGVIFIAALILTIVLISRENKFSETELDAENIEKIEIKMTDNANVYSSKIFTVKERDNINKIIEYVKRLSGTELKTNIKGLKPEIYEFTYYMKNGNKESSTHSFLQVTSNDGFQSIFSFKEVLKQITHVFTTNNNDIKKVKVFAWENEKAESPLTYYVTDKNEIESIIKIGQDNMLYDHIKANTITKLGVEFFDENRIRLFTIYISPDMYKYDELCEKVPKIKEFAEKVDFGK